MERSDNGLHCQFPESFPSGANAQNAENRLIDTKTFYLSIMYSNLIELVASEGENIKLVGGTDIHPRNHFGTQQLIDAIKKIAKAYGEAYERGQFNDKKGIKPPKETNLLYVNDMSLPYGGRFDWKATLIPPH